MTTAHLCIAIAIGLPYLGTVIAKAGGRGYGPRQNKTPRDFLATLEGFRKRAHFAQLNGFEVTPAFAAAVLVAQQVGKAPQATIDQLAVAFVVSRVLYTVCFLADWARLRSLVWTVGMALIVALFVASA
jgi:uncharacterized MAPEG superfamily protein